MEIKIETEFIEFKLSTAELSIAIESLVARLNKSEKEK